MAAMQDGPAACPTLYIKNLPEKLSRSHRLDELKGRLKLLFKPFGEILDIVALSNFYDKGQAFVVFKDTGMAVAAMQRLQGQHIEGKDMRIAFAKNKSDAAAKLQGTYVPRSRRLRPKPPSGVKKVEEEEDEEDEEMPAPVAAAPVQAYVPPQVVAAPAQAPPPVAAAPPQQPPQQLGPPPGRAPPPSAPPQQQGPPPGAPPPGYAMPAYGQPPPGYGGPPAHAPAPVMPTVTMPHPILFLENLPHDASTDDIAAVFKVFPGFKEVRLVPSRPGIGFSEFENEMQSAMALNRVQGKMIRDLPMKLTFSKS
eukprot:CAMPEP_0180405312 /NCGR_PEP_ID=MMETSP0989-20121125/40526_1 /TAXON_ID=697907 /ORGANISM="non described non described, Strain CCMP2293" /LENGTH=309 /DNA_ID=CAMNT_0022408875 /DNA_START=64 /DNA_END=993 /DNA_ORIENTATION=+